MRISRTSTVAELVRDSREEKVDVIAVALPLSAVQRIADILEQLSSTVADVCLTPTLPDSPIATISSAPSHQSGHFDRRRPLKDWQSPTRLVSTMSSARLRWYPLAIIGAARPGHSPGQQRADPVSATTPRLQQSHVQLL